MRAYPTFVLTDRRGATIDRWMGYGRAAEFIKSLREATADLTTIDRTRARFATAPTARDAAKLGRVQAASAEYAAAVRSYRQAERLDTDGATDYSVRIFDCLMSASYDSTVADDDLKAAADAVLASKQRRTSDVIGVAMQMRSYAKRQSKTDLMVPYLQAAFEASDGSAEAEVQNARRSLLVDHALYVLGDKERALAARRDLLPEGWAEDADQLNSLAWWCFENNVNLEEAETLARKGVDLAPPGREKAAILDTVAEIRNARGDRKEAVAFTEQAIEQEPKNDYYRKQLERFQKPQEETK